MNARFKVARTAIWIRVPGVAMVLFGICAPALVLTWYTDSFPSLRAQVSMTILVGIMVLASPFPDPARNQHILPPKKFETWMLVALIWMGFLIGLAAKWDMWFLIPHLSLVMGGCPVLIATLWAMLRGNWFLWAGLFLSAAVFMVYWPVAIIQYDAPWDVLLLPVIAVLLSGVFWAPIAIWTQRLAQRLTGCRVSGAGTQALFMAVWGLPTMLVAAAIPPMLQLGPNWSNISLAAFGSFWQL